MAGAIALLQFPQVIPGPNRWVVVLVVVLFIVSVVLGELFTWRHERGQPARDRELIKSAIAKFREEDRGDLPYGDLRVNGLPVGEASSPGELREQKAAIRAHFVRTHLMPRSPLQSLVDQVLKIRGTHEYDVECDFLYEIFLVNTAESQVTIKGFVAEVQIGQEWRKLKRLDDLSDYMIQTGDDWRGTRKDLVDLARLVDGVPLVRGVGYQGWLRFEFKAEHKMMEGRVNTRVKIVDAFGDEHGVTADEPLDTSKGELVHNPGKAFDP